MVVPNNHGFSYTRNDHFRGVKWGYHHLRKHPYRKHSCDRLKIPMAVRRPTLSSNSSWFDEATKRLRKARAFRLRPVFIVLASARSLALTTQQT